MASAAPSIATFSPSGDDRRFVARDLGFKSVIGRAGPRLCKGLRQLSSEGRGASTVFRSRLTEVRSLNVWSFGGRAGRAVSVSSMSVVSSGDGGAARALSRIGTGRTLKILTTGSSISTGAAGSEFAMARGAGPGSAAAGSVARDFAGANGRGVGAVASASASIHLNGALRCRAGCEFRAGFQLCEQQRLRLAGHFWSRPWSWPA